MAVETKPMITGSPSFRYWLRWFFIGLVAALAIQAAYLAGEDWNWAAPLRVGTLSASAEILPELPEVPVEEGLGHDGQWYYLYARHPLPDRELVAVMDYPALRLRRPIYPWLAGGFGTLPPMATAVGLTLWAAIGFGLLAGSTAAFRSSTGLGPLVLAGAFANVGALLSIQLVTPDVMALGMAVTGIFLVVRGMPAAGSALLALTVLTKEPMILVVAALAGWLLFRRRWRLALVVGIPGTLAFVGWSIFLMSIGVTNETATRNLGAPFKGLIESIPQWIPGLDLLTGQLAVAQVILAMAAALLVWWVDRRSWLPWLTLPWVSIAVFSTAAVWQRGNNPLRNMNILWWLAMVGIAAWLSRIRHPETQILDPASTSPRNLPV